MLAICWSRTSIFVGLTAIEGSRLSSAADAALSKKMIGAAQQTTINAVPSLRMFRAQPNEKTSAAALPRSAANAE
jgi:hypothetical protein